MALLDMPISEAMTLWARRADTRKDLQSVTEPRRRGAAQSVAAVFHCDRVQRLSYGRVRLLTEQFGLRNNLCTCERFYEQEAGAYATAFLVAPDLVATAAHVISHLDRRCFVLGFHTAESRSPVELEASRVYEAAEIVGMTLDTATGADWAVVRLGRAVPAGVLIPRIRREGRVSGGQALYTFGHPGGLPVKYADGARVRSNSRDAYFVADLDADCHSSGSPIFNADDHVIEGIVVRGEGGVRARMGCELCLGAGQGEGRGGRGEDCVRASLFAHLVPSMR